VERNSSRSSTEGIGEASKKREEVKFHYTIKSKKRSGGGKKLKPKKEKRERGQKDSRTISSERKMLIKICVGTRGGSKDS